MKTYEPDDGDGEDVALDLQVRLRPETLPITPDILTAGWYEHLPLPFQPPNDGVAVRAQDAPERTQRPKTGRTTYSCSQVTVALLAAIGFGIAYGLTVTLLERAIG